MHGRPDISESSPHNFVQADDYPLHTRAEAVAESLIALYSQLRAIGQQMLNEERPGHTLHATALVHEAVLRLSRRTDIAPDDRPRWLAAAADEMRRSLIDHARKRMAERRGGGRHRCALRGANLKAMIRSEDPEEILALHDAFLRLEGVSARAADIVRLRFYLGLTVDQTAAGLGLSRRTVLRDWEFARVFLAAQVGAE